MQADPIQPNPTADGSDPRATFGCILPMPVILYISEQCCLCVRLFNHATKRDQTLYEGVNKSGEGHCQQSKKI